MKVYLQLYRRGQDAERALRRLATVLFTEKRPENDSTDLFGRISIELMRCKGMLEAEPSLHTHHNYARLNSSSDITLF